MQTITFHASKGGSGRTTGVMALASGLLTAGKRVTVLDCTSEAGTHHTDRHRSTLQTWMSAMETNQRGAPRLELMECRTADELQDFLAAAKTNSVDVALIDTQAHSDALRIAALDHADLVILPVTGRWEARCAAKGISAQFDEATHIFGLITGNRYGQADAEKMRETLEPYPVFQSELPYSEALADQILHGDITAFTSSLACPAGYPGYARFSTARSACAAVWALTIEVLWALRGLRLGHFSPALTPYTYNRKSIA